MNQSMIFVTLAVIQTPNEVAAHLMISETDPAGKALAHPVDQYSSLPPNVSLHEATRDALIDAACRHF